MAELSPGEAVFGSCRGSFAEYAVGSSDRLVPKPERLSFEQAAAIAVAGTMALEGLRDHAQLRAGRRIALTGATGGVGSFAVQIAKASGAEVTGVAGGAAKADLVRSRLDPSSAPVTRARDHLPGRASPGRWSGTRPPRW